MRLTQADSLTSAVIVTSAESISHSPASALWSRSTVEMKSQHRETIAPSRKVLHKCTEHWRMISTGLTDAVGAKESAAVKAIHI